MEAEDLTADVFVRAFRYWDSYLCDKGSRGAWIGGIARNMLRTYFRKKAKSPQITELNEFMHADVDIEGDFFLEEEIKRVLTLLDKLPERQRDIVTMKYLLRITNRDIAKVLGISEVNVGVILHRALKKLKKGFLIEARCR
jgi:RNA polymerase sigma-70 factor (ECF subfamily)